MQRFKLLSTKQLKPIIIDQARHSGLDITVQEFISVAPILTAGKRKELQIWNDKYLVSVFTSANAVKALKLINERTRLDVCCLAGATKQAVQELLTGSNVLTVANDGTALAQNIISAGIKEVIFYCGNRRREELPTILEAAGVQVHEVVVYETVETPVRVLEPYDGILFFSPSAVSSYLSMNSSCADTVYFAIGDTTAEELKRFTNNTIITSEAPEQEKMILAAHNYFYNLTNNNERVKE